MQHDMNVRLTWPDGWSQMTLIGILLSHSQNKKTKTTKKNEAKAKQQTNKNQNTNTTQLTGCSQQFSLQSLYVLSKFDSSHI